MSQNNSSRNKLVVPGAQNAIDQMKYEIANEFGVNLGPDTTNLFLLELLCDIYLHLLTLISCVKQKKIYAFLIIFKKYRRFSYNCDRL